MFKKLKSTKHDNYTSHNSQVCLLYSIGYECTALNIVTAIVTNTQASYHALSFPPLFYVRCSCFNNLPASINQSE